MLNACVADKKARKRVINVTVTDIKAYIWVKTGELNVAYQYLVL